eukprot:g24951.t1
MRGRMPQAQGPQTSMPHAPMMPQQMPQMPQQLAHTACGASPCQMQHPVPFTCTQAFQPTVPRSIQGMGHLPVPSVPQSLRPVGQMPWINASFTAPPQGGDGASRGRVEEEPLIRGSRAYPSLWHDANLLWLGRCATGPMSGPSTFTGECMPGFTDPHIAQTARVSLQAFSAQRGQDLPHALFLRSEL